MKSKTGTVPWLLLYDRRMELWRLRVMDNSGRMMMMVDGWMHAHIHTYICSLCIIPRTLDLLESNVVSACFLKRDS